MLEDKETLEILNKSKTELRRNLLPRHVQLIALGGSIGIGLFLASGKAIGHAGPSVIIAYGICGLAVYFILRALTEMSVEIPVSGSFSAYAELYINKKAGFLSGWAYWTQWILVCIAEISATGLYTNFWFPSIPVWIPALLSLSVVSIVNVVNVRLFGEMEFWLAIIKIAAIVGIIFLGLSMIIIGVGHGFKPLGISNLWKNGGFFPNGAIGFVSSFTMVILGFTGIEFIGITAGEVAKPEKVLPKAVNTVTWRILVFYIGTMFVITSLYPWNEISQTGNINNSPFVMTFEKVGVPYAASIINFVIITASLSSCNSGMYTNARTLHNLANLHQAPKFLRKISKRKMPVNALFVTILIALFGVYLNYVMPESAFSVITEMTSMFAVLTWTIIIVVHFFKRKNSNSKPQFPMPFYPYSSVFVLLLLLSVGVMLLLDESSRLPSIVALLIIAVLFIATILFKEPKKSANK
jgi:AAT family amino acid transporter